VDTNIGLQNSSAYLQETHHWIELKPTFNNVLNPTTILVVSSVFWPNISIKFPAIIYIYIYICNISVRESCRFSFDYEHGSEASRRRISQRTHPNELNMAPLKFHYLESVKPVVAAVRWPFQLCLQEVLWKRHVKYSHFLVFFPISICGISIYNRFVFLVDNIAPQAYTSWKYIIH